MSRFQGTRRRVVFGLGAAAGVFVTRPTGHTFAATPVQRQDATVFLKDNGRVQKLEAAVKEMMDRSKANPADPAGWLANANAHRDFCATPGTSGANQIHFCWWFLPWHRAYITVTERKLRAIAKDPTLSIPYWNWTMDRRIPSLFARKGSPLAAAVRGTPNRDLTDEEVDHSRDEPASAKLGVSALTAEKFVAANLAELRLSFGGIARPNPGNGYGNSRLEGTPHGSLHVYVGGDDPKNSGDMSDFATAARDPVFFAHHGNLDRLWEIWRQSAARKASEPLSDDAFLKHSFPFIWLDGSTITISVQETMDTTSLGYVYDSLDVFRKQPEGVLIAQAPQPALPYIAKGKVSLPSSSSLEATGKSVRYLLEIEGIRPPNRPMSISVRVGAAKGGPAIPVGSFATVLSEGTVIFPDRVVQFDITRAVIALKATDLEVTLVPLDLGSTRESPPPQLPYERMRVVTTQ